MLHDPHERLTAIIDGARRVPPLPPGQRTEAHRVRGCVSVVWLVPELREGKCYFRGDAESPLVRGLMTFVAEFFSGFPPATGGATQRFQRAGARRHVFRAQKFARTRVNSFARACPAYFFFGGLKVFFRPGSS